METTITTTRCPEDERLGFLPRYLGDNFFQFEQLVYQVMGKACVDYTGGYWEFFHLSNGGFYIAWDTDEHMAVEWDENYYRGAMSAEAVSIGACMIVLSSLSFSVESERLGELFHRLRDFALQHPEAREILGFID